MTRARQGRGVDFEHRYRSSRWAEDRLITAFRRENLLALRLGPSGINRANRVTTVRGAPKAPDLLVLDPSDLTRRQRSLLSEMGDDLRSLAPGKLTAQKFSFLLKKALVAIEVEFSPYRAREMRQRDWEAKSAEALRKRSFKRASPPIAPNIFIKLEDLAPLRRWERAAKVPIVVTHVFDQEAFGVRLSVVDSVRRQLEGQREKRQIETQLGTGVFLSVQNYERPDAQAALERKKVFRVCPCAAVFAGRVTGVRVSTQLSISKSKRYVAAVIFRGGRISLAPEFMALVRRARR